MIRSRALRTVAFCVALTLLGVLTLALGYLRWDAGRSRDLWFEQRKGEIQSTAIDRQINGQLRTVASVQLTSDSDLEVSFRVLRDGTGSEPLPVLIVLGGHRTGSRAIRFFDDVGERAIVALDYPYDGPQKVRGLAESARTIPLIRQAFLDTPPAISLTLDWLHEQPWVDRKEIVMVGVSLGVPFSATAAARDTRLSGLVLIHGAADNRLWLEQNIARRIDAEFLRPAMATLMHWLAYGPLFDTKERVAAVSPRPVVIVGARNDERMPDDQTERLFEAARQPKTLRWTDGSHVDPDRDEVIEALLEIADEELPFPAAGL